MSTEGSSVDLELNLARASLRRWLCRASGSHPDRAAVEAALEQLDILGKAIVVISGLAMEI